MKKEDELLTPEQIKNLGGGVRIKPVVCGKKSCRRCPHFIYVYKRVRVDKKIKELYVGKAKV